MLRDRDDDLYAKECRDGIIIFWFRHWTWGRDRYLPDHVTGRGGPVYPGAVQSPVFFSGWNHVGLARLLP
jgi:hypothetical protein